MGLDQMTTAAAINTILAGIATVAWIWWLFHNRKHWGYFVLPMIYLGSVLLFYAIYYFHLMSIDGINAYSNYIRMLTLFTAIAMPFIFKPGRRG